MTSASRSRQAPGLLAAAVWLAVLVWLAGCSGGPSEPTGIPSSRITYAALGASDAVGIGAFPLSEGYVFEIADHLRAVRDEVSLHNLGVNGAEMEEFLRDELEPAVAAEPDLITIWAGTNDVVAGRTPERFAGELDTLLAELRARTSATIYIGDLADLSDAPLFRLLPDPDVTSARFAAFNARISSLAARHGAVLVRISAIPVTDSLFSIDGFHPSNAGHDRIADAFWAEIAPRL